MSEETKKPEVKQEEIKKEEPKAEDKKAEIKVTAKKAKRDFALINGLNLHISTKAGAHICDAIRYRNIDKAIAHMEMVAAGKRAIRMNNREVGHRHDPGMMAGRYPITAAKEFVSLLKNLRANAIYHEVEIEKAVISQAICNQAPRPFKRGGARAKRSHVMLKLEVQKDRMKNNENKKKQGGSK